MIPTACVSNRWEEEGLTKTKNRFEVEREAAVMKEGSRRRNAYSIDPLCNPGNMPARFVAVVVAVAESTRMARMQESVVPVKVT